MNEKTPNDEISLTGKQLKFALEYLRDFNGTQAALRAGYKPSNAHGQAARNLRNKKIKAYLKGKIEKAGPDTDLLLQELFKVAMGVSDGKTLKAADKVAAADKLLRVAGAYKDKSEQTSTNFQPTINLTIKKNESE